MIEGPYHLGLADEYPLKPNSRSGPRLPAKHLQAVFAYPQECIKDGLLISHIEESDRGPAGGSFR